jgi:hypothetical protein
MSTSHTTWSTTVPQPDPGIGIPAQLGDSAVIEPNRAVTVTELE